jgi:alanine-synthesizing transaminase
VCSEETLRALIDLAHKHNLVLFADEIYDKLIFEGKHIALASLDHDVPVVTFNGLSKSYLVPGFRIGWGVVSGSGPVLSDYIEAINKLLRARLCANHPEQYAIKPALEGSQDHVAEMMERLRRRRDMTYNMLNAVPGISCVKPAGAFYAFPRLEIEESDDAFVQGLIRDYGVVVVPGSGFGQVPGTKHFRVVFLPPEDVLERAFKNIAAYRDR